MSLPPLTTLFCIDFPPDILVGIDFYYLQSNTQFAGIKLIPPGTHTFHWGGTEASTGRSGIFFTGTNEEKLVFLKWDAEQERAITEEEMLPLDVSKFKTRLGDMYKFMIVYEELARQTIEKSAGTFTAVSWQSLANHITSSTYSRILPKNGVASSILTTQQENELLSKSLHDAAKDRAKMERSVPNSEVADDEIIQGLLNQTDQEMHFTSIDIKSRLRNPSFTGRNLTALYLDKTWYLNEILRSSLTPGFKSFLGEVEFAFLMLLIYANYSAAIAWFNLIRLVLDCETAFVSSTHYSALFLRLLKNQLLILPSEYQDQFWSRRDFQRLMGEFHEKIYSPEGWNLTDAVLEALCSEIFATCETTMGLVFPDSASYAHREMGEEEEDGPTIVET